jgi:ClpA/ClpB-like protein
VQQIVNAGGGHSISAAHLAAALFCEPEGLAAKAITEAGLTPEQVYAAFGTGPAVRQNQDADQIAEFTAGRKPG